MYDETPAQIHGDEQTGRAVVVVVVLVVVVAVRLKYIRISKIVSREHDRWNVCDV